MRRLGTLVYCPPRVDKLGPCLFCIRRWVATRALRVSCAVYAEGSWRGRPLGVCWTVRSATGSYGSSLRGCSRRQECVGEQGGDRGGTLVHRDAGLCLQHDWHVLGTRYTILLLYCSRGQIMVQRLRSSRFVLCPLLPRGGPQRAIPAQLGSPSLRFPNWSRWARCCISDLKIVGLMQWVLEG